MNIIIVGVGKVGYAITKHLSSEGENVTVIDTSTLALERVNNTLDVMCIKGNCTSLRVLNEADVKNADLVISVTNSDELNMLCSLAAKKLGAKHTIARVRTPGYDEDIRLFTEAVGIDLIINPEKAAAAEISKLIKYPSVCSIDDFSNGKVNLIGFKISDESLLVDKRVSEIDYIRGNILVCGIEREDKFIIPNGDYVFHKDDRVYIIGQHEHIEKFFKKLGKYKKNVRTAMIIGGSKVSYYLSKIINDVGVNCKIIERDFDKCEELTQLLPKSVIINGDGMEEDLLLSENISEVDSFITLTGRDEDNLIASLFASKMGAKNIITKITRDNYNDIAKTIGIDSTISPKVVTANKIIKYVRSLRCSRKHPIENIYKICNEKAEAIEFILDENSNNLNKSLKDIKFKDNCIIAIIVRGEKIIIPTGDDYLQVNDKVIIVNSNIKPLEFNEIFIGGEA